MVEGARQVEAGFSGHAGRVGEISLLLSMRSPSGAVDWVLRHRYYASSLLYPFARCAPWSSPLHHLIGKKLVIVGRKLSEKQVIQLDLFHLVYNKK